MILINFKYEVTGAFIVFAAGVFAGRFTAPNPVPTRLQVVSVPTEDEQSPKLRAKVQMARQSQIARFAGKDIVHNAAIPGGAAMEYCQLSPQGMEHYKNSLIRMCLPRGQWIDWPRWRARWPILRSMTPLRQNILIPRVGL